MDLNEFNMNGQAGAPPDDFAVDGQNWQFPTYNWEEMANNGFKWWQTRLTHLSTYFDAFRFDHILGFFRIWEIPYDAVSGLLGHFRPAISIDKSELDSLNIDFNEERFCVPYIRSSYIYDKFGEEAQMIIDNYLDEYAPGCFKMKPGFETQREIEDYFAIPLGMPDSERVLKTKTKKILFSLLTEVLFIKDARKENSYHPRISIDKTLSFAELDKDAKKKVYNLYLDYFYHRQENLWKEQALIKLPALTNATNMLICGEDLGMIPDCVPGVMNDLNILSLKIQRMPKDSGHDFGIPSDYPYLSVCSPSCHDMTTVRGWWEEDAEKRQKFYNIMLGREGEAPIYCEPWICDEIIQQHLYSPSMWAIFPIQDLIATNAGLRRTNPADEQINDPSNPKHYWKYRFHIPLEKLLKEDSLNKHIRDMVEASGRDKVAY
jgi:4-alpha-glucanotransferase